MHLGRKLSLVAGCAEGTWHGYPPDMEIEVNEQQMHYPFGVSPLH